MDGRWPRLKQHSWGEPPCDSRPSGRDSRGTDPPSDGPMPQPTPVRKGDPVGTTARRPVQENLAGAIGRSCVFPGTPGRPLRLGA
ncbi:hypothetical protein N7517_011716 [Penicillium concentricum]|uniref:Uncharacterized protein n=1 Tax=Penicillium concentricum TaxID=293559 RepID=A0A9W9UR37_9EURO|nr:uncharacterized protein N7517_011716 [Penicillium concentricum]KAJ5354413.1 hypothetical protein N7517_011716 [Penicillium concentricum]